MNLPNKLSLLRLILCPVFLFVALAGFIPCNFLWAAIVFAVASFTDFLDGHIARKYNLVTNFGKFLDPVADKVIVFAAFTVFLYLDPCRFGVWMVWIFMIMIARELLVTSFRAVASSKNVIIAADIFGKMKTFTQMFAVIFILLECQFKLYPYPYIGAVLLVVSAVLTVLSGINYIVKNREVLKDIK